MYRGAVLKTIASLSYLYSLEKGDTNQVAYRFKASIWYGSWKKSEVIPHRLQSSKQSWFSSSQLLRFCLFGDVKYQQMIATLRTLAGLKLAFCHASLLTNQFGLGCWGFFCCGLVNLLMDIFLNWTSKRCSLFK